MRLPVPVTNNCAWALARGQVPRNIAKERLLNPSGRLRLGHASRGYRKTLRSLCGLPSTHLPVMCLCCAVQCCTVLYLSTLVPRLRVGILHWYLAWLGLP